jgi:hypothetical protein
VNRFQFVADHHRRDGVKRLRTLLGIARSSSPAGARHPRTGPPGTPTMPGWLPGYGPCTTGRMVPTAPEDHR